MGRRYKGEIQQRHERDYSSVKEPTRAPSEESTSLLTLAGNVITVAIIS